LARRRRDQGIEPARNPGHGHGGAHRVLWQSGLEAVQIQRAVMTFGAQVRG
jgi:hypothetical protein